MGPPPSDLLILNQGLGAGSLSILAWHSSSSRYGVPTLRISCSGSRHTSFPLYTVTRPKSTLRTKSKLLAYVLSFHVMVSAESRRHLYRFVLLKR
jgi:hypothetical protein